MDRIITGEISFMQEFHRFNRWIFMIDIGKLAVTVATVFMFGSSTSSGVTVTDSAESAHGWALTNVSVACVREKAGHASELGTQVVMGTPLRILNTEGGWHYVETPDGYRGYVIDNSLVYMSEEAMDAWRSSARYVVAVPDQTYVYELADNGHGHPMRVSDVVNGCVLEDGGGMADGKLAVRLPDGRKGFIGASEVQPLDQLAAREVNLDELVEFALNLMGTPYLWGGTSTKSMDCSGLTKICYLAQGVVLPRNASAQAKIGSVVDKTDVSSMRTGDLLFFGNASTGRVNHVGIYMDDGRFVHSSGRVKVNSIVSGDKLYHKQDLLAVRRLDKSDWRKMGLKNHRWYF